MIVEEFFQNLAERFRKENDLSDFTWALCKSCPDFMEGFMRFFGFRFATDIPWSINRERREGASQPDIKVEQADKVYLVENKIYDRVEHFAQYDATYQKAEKGFIANYRVDPLPGWAVRTWDEFVHLLVKDLKEKAYEDSVRALITAYIKYVREVCGLMEIKEMRFENLTSLTHFARLLDQLIQSPPGQFETDACNQGKAVSDCEFGRYFWLKKKGGKAEIYPWLGIWFGDDSLCIFMHFRADWCKRIHSHFKNAQGGKYYKKPYYNEDDYDALEFEMKSNVFLEFSQASLERQKEILRDFYDEVLVEVGRFL
jgi:hypothetical protein